MQGRARRALLLEDLVDDVGPAARVLAQLDQTVLLGDRSGVDHILEAIRKIHAHSGELAKRA